MVRSQQQCRRGRQLLLLVAVVAVVFLIAAGSADAVCYKPNTNCGGNCVNLKNSKYHCGWCNHKCVLSSAYKNGEVYCSGGKCYSRCKSGWKYNSKGKYCYK